MFSAQNSDKARTGSHDQKTNFFEIYLTQVLENIGISETPKGLDIRRR